MSHTHVVPHESTPSDAVPAGPSWLHRIVAAVTSDTAAEAVIRLTHTLATERGATATVLSVVHDMLGLGVSTVGAMTNEPDAPPSDYQNQQLVALESQVVDILGQLPAWRYEVDVGATVPTIVRRVRELDADLVLLGLPHHNFLHRALLRDAIQGVIDDSRAAVLAVLPGLDHRPRRVVVAVDFSTESLRAAHLACQIVAPAGHVILVYVQSTPSRRGTREKVADALQMQHVNTALTKLIEELAAHKAITMTSVIEHGSSIEGVKRAALRVRPDLVALGSHPQSVIDWFFGDSVSTELIDERRWSLLVVPAT